MKILVSGAGFVNKGAEAMLRTVQVELTKRLPAAAFFLWRPEETDRRSALNSGLIPLFLPIDSRTSRWRRRVRGPIWCLEQICRTRDPRRIVSLFGRKRRLSAACVQYLHRALGGFDALVDVSGFAYGDAWNTETFDRNQPIIQYCRKHGKPAVFLPQAWGSFSKPEIRKAILTLLGNPTVTFYSRDNVSCRCLEQVLGRSEGAIMPRPDIAFGFRGGTADQGRQVLGSMGCSMKRPIVGISPNMRVFERVAGQGTRNEYLQALVRLVEHCLRAHDVDVVLQANEIDAHGSRTDDRYLCSLIAASVGKPDRCFMTRASLSAEASRALIGRFSLLIGSRFHSLVFGFSQGVPAMAVSWSPKYRELFSLFGMENDVRECEEIDVDALISTFERCWIERQERQSLILKEMESLQARVGTLFDDVAATIRGKCRDESLDTG